MTTHAELPFRASRYTTGAIILHWTIALLILAQIVGGYAMNDILEDGSQDQYELFQLHKSLGIMVLVLTVARIMWRIFNPPPAEPASVARWESRLAHVVHILFYVLLLAIPLSGWVLISVAPIRVETVLFFRDWLPWPDIPGLGALPAGTKDILTETGEEVHAFLAWSAAVLVGLHALGAIKHHIQDGHFLIRMSPFAGGDGPRNSYGHAVTWLTMVIFFGAMVGAAAWARYGDQLVADAPAAVGAVSPDQAAALTTGAAASGATADTAPLWTVDTAASTLGYAFIYQDNTITGTLPDFTAEIRFSAENLPASSISATIELATVAIAEGSLTVAQLRGADGLDTKTAATATFTSDKIEAADGGFVAHGTLALRGRTAPVDLAFTLTEEGEDTIAEGTARLTREAFGFGEASSLGDALGPDVEVSLRLVARPAQD